MECSAYTRGLTGDGVLRLAWTTRVDYLVMECSVSHGLSGDLCSAYMRGLSGNLCSAYMRGLTGDLCSAYMRGLTGDLCSAYMRGLTGDLCSAYTRGLSGDGVLRLHAWTIW
jgi:predicted alpha/beta-fold hydrolase